MTIPFLFVGCGGSGTEVLRRLRRELEYRLDLAKWGGSFPDAWQFLAIDVPKTEGSTSELLQYSHGSYVGLADRGIGYRGRNGADDQLASRAQVRHDYLQWRPNPSSVNVNITKGAGQYRAVGRVVVGLWGDRELSSQIDRSVSKLQSLDEPTLAQLRRTLGMPLNLDASSRPDPVVVIVSSLAGGAGSGTFMDIADMLRRASTDQTKWLTRSLAFLFDPSIFKSTSDMDTSGLPANALAAVSELVAGRWQPWTDFPYTPSLVGEPAELRGPEFSFLVGSQNERVQFKGLDNVYEAIAQLLAGWTLNPDIAARLTAHIQGNWSTLSAATNSPLIHDPDLTNSNKALSAMGFARISLGRERFGVYGSERLTRELLLRMATVHVDQAVTNGRKTERERINELVEENGEERVDHYIEDCGLNERSTKNNEVIDRLRSKEERITQIKSLQSAVAKKVNEPQNVLGRFNEAMNDHLETRLAAVIAAEVKNARRWSETIQARILDTTCRIMAVEGIPVATEIVRRAAHQIRVEFPDELRREADGEDNELLSALKVARTAITNAIPRRARSMPAGVSTIVDGIVQERLYKEAEVAMLKMAASLLEDLGENFFEPLLDAMTDLHETLKADVTAKRLEHLSGSTVPTRLVPADNELLIDSHKHFPEVFNRLVEQTSTTLNEALVEVASAKLSSVETSAELPNRLRPWLASPWVPRLRDVGVTPATPAKLKPVLQFGMKEVLERSLAWMVEDPNRPVGMYMNESLRSHLAGEGLTKQTLKDRASTFAAFLMDGFDRAQPFVALDEKWVEGEYGEAQVVIEVSKLPLAPGEPAYATVNTALNSRLPPEKQGEANFDTQAAGDIEIYTYLKPLSPTAFATLTAPIVASYGTRNQARKLGAAGEFWKNRRARPLLDFIPLPQSSRLTLARGFLTARMAGRVELGAGTCHLRTGPRTKKAFLSPPLGAPTDRFDWFAMALESALLAEMLAAKGQDDAFVVLHELMKLGSSDGLGVPSLDYPTRNGLLQSSEVASNLVEEQVTEADVSLAVDEWLRRGLQDWYRTIPTPAIDSNITSIPIGDQIQPLIAEAADQILEAGVDVARARDQQRFGG